MGINVMRPLSDLALACAPDSGQARCRTWFFDVIGVMSQCDPVYQSEPKRLVVSQQWQMLRLLHIDLSMITYRLLAPGSVVGVIQRQLAAMVVQG